MLAWEWTIEKAREGEGEVEKKAATHKISQTAQVQKQKNMLVWVQSLLTGTYKSN